MSMKFLRPIALLPFLALISAPALAAQPSSQLTKPSTPAPSSQTQQKPKINVKHVQDWDVRCAAGSQKRCEMTQTVNRKKDNKPMMRVVVGYPPQSQQPVAIFDLPLGMRLPPGVKLSVDGNKPVSFPVQLCVQQGCRADLPLKSSVLSQLRAGHTATVTIHDPRGKAMNLDISLMGFTNALNQVSP